MVQPAQMIREARPTTPMKYKEFLAQLRRLGMEVHGTVAINPQNGARTNIGNNREVDPYSQRKAYRELSGNSKYSHIVSEIMTARTAKQAARPA